MLHTTIILYFLGLLVIGSAAAFFSGLLGIGGGIFYVPGLNQLFVQMGFVTAVSMHLALGTSTCVNVFNSTINILRHRKHQKINWGVAKSLIPTMMIGAFAGGYVAGYLPAAALKVFFTLFLLAIGLQYTLKKHHQSVKPLPGRIFMTCAGFVIGVIASINGLGGGIIMVPFLHRYNLQMREIVAISAACILPQSMAGTCGYIISGWGHSELPAYSLGYVYLPVVIPLVITSLIFAPLGVKLVHTLPHATVRKVFGLMLLVLCTFMLYSVFTEH